MKKIGVLGGTFNPPHIGHILLAKFAREELNLDKVLFIPCYIPPHKKNLRIPPASVRLRMVKAAVRSCKEFEVSDLEIKRKGISYTVDTLTELKKKYPLAKLYLIIGGDLLKGLKKWKDFGKIKKLAVIAAAKRKKIKSQKIQGVVFLDFPRIDISSSYIRKRVFLGKSIDFLVVKPVQKIIKQYNLYKT